MLLVFFEKDCLDIIYKYFNIFKAIGLPYPSTYTLKNVHKFPFADTKLEKKFNCASLGSIKDHS